MVLRRVSVAGRRVRAMEASPAPRSPSLSPSRAADFMQCPLLYRFRVIDRLPEEPSPAATRGTVVHAVLERLFDVPAGERTVGRVRSLVEREWERLLTRRPELASLFADEEPPPGVDGAAATAAEAPAEDGAARLARWLADAEKLVERWFTLEDPTRLEPAEREMWVETRLDSGLRLRGVIDRVDIAPTGEVRIVDYKTGKAPRPQYAADSLFQMKFYALVLWRLKGVLPRRLQLVYLGSGDVRTYDPVESDLHAVERKLLALWEAIREATETGDWRPRRTKLCGWCSYQSICPEFGGTPPPYPLLVQDKLPLEDVSAPAGGPEEAGAADGGPGVGGEPGVDGADGSARTEALGVAPRAPAGASGADSRRPGEAPGPG
ncbi:PD-(D/E)XK nuclease family protein [Streptomyces otsuchiensis]|uniref:RecB family exonuclease n=1 Tax=Streptomyces otsuchiensis TaxID=2681388 RepID=UPI0015814E53